MGLGGRPGAVVTARVLDRRKEDLKRLERDYLVNELLDRITTNVKVGQDQEMQYFNQHKDEFSYEVKITRIVMADSLMAAQTLAELKAGADFTKLAKERSQDVALEAGAESRYFARNVGDPRMGGDPAVAEAIFTLSAGQISDVVPSQEGYQIIKLVDKKKVKADVTFPEAKDEIEAILISHAHQDHIGTVPVAMRRFPKARVFMPACRARQPRAASLKYWTVLNQSPPRDAKARNRAARSCSGRPTRRGSRSER